MDDIKQLLDGLMKERHNYKKNSEEIYSLIDTLFQGVQDIIVKESNRQAKICSTHSEDDFNEYIIYMVVEGSSKKTLIAKFILNASCAYPVLVKYNQLVEYAGSKSELKEVLLALVRDKINALIDIATLS